MHEVDAIEFGREICGEADSAFQREWLVTNGIGGFASGTLGDALTRRYHGLLMAALAPPLGRTLLLAKIEATAAIDGRTCELGANRWADGTIGPHGYREIERFRLDGSVPTWSYAFSDVELERTIWMESGENTTYVRYALQRATQPVTLAMRFLVNARDYHGLTRAYDVHDATALSGRTARVQLSPQAPELFLACDRGEFQPGAGWYYGFRLEAETARGLDDLEDHFNAVNVVATLEPGEALTVVASTEQRSGDDAPASFERRVAKDRALLDGWRKCRGITVEPAW
ncbi:MAG TPA: glycogen debranching enzyme N-terminal domain-containing protein, partial [Candidatus Baltobacteraceae bacterium]|nr:glycogen debranching enzyme N-terminal domain-containing protein [Candidatus Baltobacteraceae bacterium]